ncbi:MAG TPA: NUDIX domain-containing protein [Candidatus Paceibacterota bacterium]|nr:NUDIX domain-containing protein [Candidatus Paceibacterota bacterium]
MIKYTKKDNGLQTEFEFIPSTTLPTDLPISTPLTFTFIGENLVITQKQNGDWDIPGGKIESGETWHEALHREVREECGVTIDHVRLIGYILAKNSGDLSLLKHEIINVLPVTVSFVQSVDLNWSKKETINRDAPARDTVQELFTKRDDGGQLLEIFNYAINDFKSQDYISTFDYVKNMGDGEVYPNTQSVVFIKNKDNKFVLVRENGEIEFTLPGGGCHIYETGLDCVLRESREETQIEITDVRLIGTVIVKLFKGDKLLSVSTQQRYVADIEEMYEFIPNKDGFEIEERKLVNFDELKGEAKILKNPTGDDILSDLKNFL